MCQPFCTVSWVRLCMEASRQLEKYWTIIEMESGVRAPSTCRIACVCVSLSLSLSLSLCVCVCVCVCVFKFN